MKPRHPCARRRGTFLAISLRIGGAIIATPFRLEVAMLGRRSHARISLESGAEGVLSLARDISVRVSGDGHLVAISRDAAAIGERVRVLLADDEVTVVAEVIESKPVVCDGAVRHRLLMRCSGRDVVSSNRVDGPHE
jgi:hypothetical protein